MEKSQSEKVSNIKYKRMDNDPDIKRTITEIERLILGEKGIGLMDALKITPGRVQKQLDDEWDQEFERILEDNKDYIFWEARKRSAAHVHKWIEEQKNEINEEDLLSRMQEGLKLAEIEVVRELLEREGLI
ncbi:hypothetical protein [Bacillus mesophilum]|uniref:Uncharacterized protein n=1 Tax=Bacillus mesophilum TaxID=1071718 RepID=A0A7V7RHW3_9BACI|nr:hypothetical protein [Bacillus mesophilum]KAB2329425.1 hypothetical protein F7732_21100 [Bacillus mesophilum]